ncbi:tetratricopeptide repeat protein [Desulfosarcina variabilis str. Montpellier]
MEIFKYFKWLAGLLLVLVFIPALGMAREKDEAPPLPLPAQLILAKVQPMIEAKEYPRAIETLKTFQARGGPDFKLGDKDPKGYHHAEIEFCLGNCYLMGEQYEDAVAAYQRALARDPGHTYAWLNLANAHYELNHNADAASCFKKAYETATEKKPEYLYYSAVAYLMADDYKQSIGLFEELFAAHPEAIKLEWKEHMVHALLAAEKPRRALPYIKELAAAFTGEKQIQWQEILLHQYMQLDMQREALDLAHTLTRQTPTLAKWWKALAHIQLNVEKYEDALMALTIYSFLTPLSMEEKKLLADLNLQLNIPVKAAPLYEACLKEKKDKSMLQQLATAYRQLGKPETALAVINAVDPDSDDADIILLKGELYYSMDKFDQAVAAYEKAARNKGRHVGRAWLMAGYAAWQMNDIATSKDAFAKAAKHRKQRKAANTALKQLAMLSVDEMNPHPSKHHSN